LTAGKLLELRHLRKAYGATMAVDGIDLAVGSGEFVTLLGPSGSGKTTTLAMIAGLVEPSGGEILLDGRAIGRLPPWRREIGVVFQHYALFPHMTVAGNVAFPLEMRRVGRAEIGRRVGRALAMVGLGELGGRYPRQLSGGQQQRVALARAIVFEPRLLLMDEPLGALDKKLREQMQTEILRLHRELGIAVVYVTHDQEEALVMSDRIAVFDQGRLQQVGTPEELYESPRSRFVAAFVGDTNLLDGRVSEVDAGFVRVDCGGVAVRARNPAGLGPGDVCVVAIRPERVGMEAAPENAVAGRVREVVYLGKSRRYVTGLADGREITALDQGGFERGSPVAIGSAVHLSWSADHAVALPAT
jgi:putative spermidine/putrescine transport system ATP-binding protein